MSWAGEMYMEEVARRYTERGHIASLDGDTAVWRCDTCYALVVNEDRRDHYEWHLRQVPVQLP